MASVVRRLIEMQGAPLCVFGFCSCVRVGLLVMIPSLVGGAAGGVVLFCVVCEKCFPVFLETGLSLIFCDLGFCCCVVWGCRAAGFAFLALTNRGLRWFKCWAPMYE